MNTFTAVEQLHDVLDDRTLDILERRSRSKAGVGRRGWLVRRALVTADLLGLCIAFVAAERLIGFHKVGALGQASEFAFFAASLPFWIIAAKVYGLYDRDEERADHSTFHEVAGVFHLVTVCTWLLYAASLLTAWFNPAFSKLFLFWILAVVAISAGRALARGCCRRSIRYIQNTIIVGAGVVGQTIAEKVLRHPEYGINLVGFVDEEPRERSGALAHLTVLGGQDDLEQLIDLLDVERVIIGFTRERHEESLDLLRRIAHLDVQVDIVPRLFEAVGPSAGIHMVEGIPLMGLPPLSLSRSSLLLKRATDILIAAVALVLLLPVMLVCVLAIRVDSRGPAFYWSERIGRRGSRFSLLKFRTMKTDASDELADLLADPLFRAEFEATHKLGRDPRVTRLGRLLRKLSVDELPQLINVIRGDMSLVGPRPITVEEFDFVAGTEIEELGYWALSNFRPGVTGYWQINGRSAVGYRERVRLDLVYLSSWSIRLDLEIIARTAAALSGRAGAY